MPLHLREHRVRTREAQVMVAPGDCNAQATT